MSSTNNPLFDLDFEGGVTVSAGFDDMMAAQTLDDLVNCLGLDNRDLDLVHDAKKGVLFPISTFHTEDRWPI